MRKQTNCLKCKKLMRLRKGSGYCKCCSPLMGKYLRTEDVRKKIMGELNSSKRSDVRQKIKNGVRQFYAQGGKSWNKGLTKRTSQIVKEIDTKRVKTVLKNGTFRGKNNPMFGKHFSNEVRERISKGYVNTYFKKGFNYAGIFWSKKNNKAIGYRSTWELHAMQIFEQLDEVVRYEYETLSIPYLDKRGYKHLTIPDFLLYYADGTRKIIEVKPEFMIKKNLWNTNAKINVAKNFAKENGMSYCVWTEKQLK